MTNYKDYCLQNLSNWIHDAVSSGDATPQEIYDSIKETVREEYYYYKDKASQTYELLSLLGSENNSFPSAFSGSVIDFSSLGSTDTFTFSTGTGDGRVGSINDWNDEPSYSEEELNNRMRPWGHSDLEYGLSNSVLTEDRISNFPGEQYSEEELNAMCDKSASEQEKEKCREYNLREAEYYDKRAKLDGNQEPYQDYIGWQNLTSNDFDKIFPIPKMDKVAKWVLPVEVDGLTGDCVVTLPDDLLERVGWVEGDTVEFLSNPSGSFTVKKVVKSEVENI